jgi:uncharacterized 2Fe-2S/4Fe-4S cluster protein (DUF4445 family)
VKSPLALDKDNVKKLEIPEDIEISPVHKIGFLQDQLEQIQHMHWRARVDMLHAARLQEEDNEVLREKGLSNMATHRNEAQQSIGAIVMLKKLIQELREEYPELKPEE